MAAHTQDDKLLIHFFQESLAGATYSWYLNLEKGQIKTWADLVDAFLHQYRYNKELAPNQTQLQNMAKEASKTFKEYAQRWREVAAHVQPLLSDKEMVTIFIETLQPSFYKNGRKGTNRNGGKERENQSSSNWGTLSKKKGVKKEEANAITSNKTNNGVSHKASPFQPMFHPKIPATTSAPFNYLQASYRPHYPAGLGSPSNLPRHLTPTTLVMRIPCDHCTPKTTYSPYPKNYDLNAKCDYHTGAIRHSTEKCWSLKHKVQDLVDVGRLQFQEKTPPLTITHS
ncbi:hypothetical protein CR513_54178, partial [Mucuna pruriens]